MLSADLRPSRGDDQPGDKYGCSEETSGQTNPRARLHQGDADLCTGDAPAYPRFIPPGGPSRPWQLIRFRHFIDGSLALASLNRTCRDHRPDVSAALTTVAFDQSGPRWLGISDLIAEPEGPTFISYKVARSRLDRLRFVTQDPEQNSPPGGLFFGRLTGQSHEAVSAFTGNVN